MINCSRRQAHADMEVNLLLFRDFQRGSKVQQVTRPASFRKVTRVLYKGIPGFGLLPI